MKFLKQTFLILFLFGVFIHAHAQSLIVNGTVTNQLENAPVTNHLVTFSIPPIEALFTTTTDDQGYFTLSFDVNITDSMYVSVSTIDPCTGDALNAYVFPNFGDNFVEFIVCEDSIIQEDCMAAFEYYYSDVADSISNGGDSIFFESRTVSFYDYSLGNISNWEWHFDDGTTSTEQNPSHTYSNDGEYHVTLIINGESCNDSTTIPVWIGNFEPECQAYFDYSYGYWEDSLSMGDSIIFDEKTIHFFDHSSGNPTNWFWNFGDGTTSTEQNPVHTYSSSGKYTVILSIAGDSCQSSTTMPVWVGNIEPECNAMFYYSPEVWSDSTNTGDSTVVDLKTIHFYDLSTGAIENWLWEFGDGSSSTEQNPIHTYQTDGEYYVTLSIFGDSCSSTITELVWAGSFEPGCQAMFEYIFMEYSDSVNTEDSMFIDSKTIQFIDNSYGSITSWYWDFGDGATSAEQNPLHTYDSEGEYYVTLTINGDSCESSVIEYVWVGNFEPNCQAMFDYYYENLGDSIFIDDSTNVFDSIIFTYNTVYFYDYSYGNITEWLWDFGDGNTSIEQNPVHTYVNEGEYFVTLSISGETCQSEFALPVWIGNNNYECEAMFGYDYYNWSDTIDINPTETDFMTLYFYDFSYGNPTSWEWDFGDGNSSYEQHPMHTYTESGTYLVNLTISSENCFSNYSLDVFVGEGNDTIWYPEDCMAMFYPNMEGENTVEFINESYGEIISYYWTFGDGSGSTEENPTHTYASEGEYLVTLAIETVDSCTSSIEMYIYVSGNGHNDEITALFVPEIDGKTVTFHDQSEGDIWNRYWDFGDGESSTAKNPVHTYDDFDTYIVTLGVGNASAVNTFTMEINLAEGTYIGYFAGTTDVNDQKVVTLSNSQVYPLPLQSELTIRLNSKYTSNGTVQITSLSGQVISQKQVQFEKGTNTQIINVDNLNNGVYLLQIISDNKDVITHKLVK